MIDTLRINGRLTLGENIADVVGLQAAYDAYRASLGGKEPPVIDGFTGDQRFFLAYAQVWRAKKREDAARAEAEVEWSDRESVIEYLVRYSRLLAGGQRPFDEAACRDLLQRDADRADNLASLRNHDVMAHGEIVKTCGSGLSVDHAAAS